MDDLSMRLEKTLTKYAKKDDKILDITQDSAVKIIEINSISPIKEELSIQLVKEELSVSPI